MILCSSFREEVWMNSARIGNPPPYRRETKMDSYRLLDEIHV